MSDDDQGPANARSGGHEQGSGGNERHSRGNDQDPRGNDQDRRDGADPARGGERPAALIIALAVVALQVLGLTVLAVAGLGGLVGTPAAGQITIVTLAVVLLGLAFLIGAAAWALWQGRRWGRGPVVTWQLLLLVIGVSRVGADAWWATVLPAVAAVVVLVGVLTPASRRATDRRGRPDAVL